jgi:hypothetical protein
MCARLNQSPSTLSASELEGVKWATARETWGSVNLGGKSFDVVNAGLRSLEELTNLTSLKLDSCHQITDMGLASVTRLSNLVSLDISYCRRLTDEGIASLQALHSLTLLRVRGLPNQIIGAALDNLSDRLTNLRISS